MNGGPNPKFYAVLVVVALLGGAGLDYVAYGKVQSSQQKLDAIKSEQESIAKVPERLKQSQANLTSTQEGLRHLEQGVPSSAYVPTMMQELEALGNSCNVTVTSVRPALAPPAAPTTAAPKEKAASPYDTIDLEIRGTGHYNDALRFVSALNKFPKVVEARAVSLEKVTHADRKAVIGSPELALTVQLRAYLFKGDATRTALNSGGGHAG